MTKHTPGPWHVIERGNGQAFSIGTTVRTKSGMLTQHYIAHVSDMPTKQARINADLIAAAPQMLEALKWACDERANRCICEADCDGEPPCTAEACPIYEAIKAATGVEKDRFYGWP